MANYGQQINFVASLTTNVAILLTGSRGGTRTHDTHRMKVLHWPLCYSTMVPEGGNDPPTPTLSRLCSTTELLGYKIWPVRRDSNSRQLVSKTRTLPLSYGPIINLDLILFFEQQLIGTLISLFLVQHQTQSRGHLQCIVFVNPNSQYSLA